MFVNPFIDNACNVFSKKNLKLKSLGPEKVCSGMFFRFAGFHKEKYNSMLKKTRFHRDQERDLSNHKGGALGITDIKQIKRRIFYSLLERFVFSATFTKSFFTGKMVKLIICALALVAIASGKPTASPNSPSSEYSTCKVHIERYF